MLLFAFSISFIHAQAIKVSGTVYDESKVPLPGVSVLVEGTNKGTVTDFDGNFTLDVTVNSMLKFSYLGYVSQTIKVVQSRAMEVVLKEFLRFLNFQNF